MSVVPLRSEPHLSADEPKMKGKKPLTDVPNLVDSLWKMTSAEWLRISDEDEAGAREQMTGENVNMALICALLLTVFVPIYYSEPSRLNLPDDGVTIDILRGWLSSMGALHLSKKALHEIFDIGYFFSVCGSLIGTFTSVFISLAANESSSDSSILVLRKHLGVLSTLPYLCFTVAMYGFAVPYCIHFAVVPRTIFGEIIKIGAGLTIVLIFVYTCAKITQGMFLAKREEARCPPLNLGEKELQQKAGDFFSNADDVSDRSVKAFLDFVRGDPNEFGYRPQLSFPTRIQAGQVFMEHTCKILGMSLDQLKRLDAITK